MVFPLNYIMAVLTPSGRIAQFPFAMVAVALAVANIWLYNEALYARGGVGDTWMLVVLALIWMKFCVMSRRMHDTGSNGAILVPFLIVALAVFLVSYNPGIVGAGKEAASSLSMVIDHGQKVVRSLFVAIFIYLLRAPSEDGPNAYGEEWDAIAQDTGKKKTTDRGKDQASKSAAVTTTVAAPSRFSANSRNSRAAMERLSALGGNQRRTSAPVPAAATLASKQPRASQPRAFSKRG